MDYIYKGLNGRKHVGEVFTVYMPPYHAFTVKLKKGNTLCIMKTLHVPCSVYIDLYDSTIELAHPADTFWNAEAIYHQFNDWDTGSRIAGAIKVIYETERMSKKELHMMAKGR